MIGLTGQTGAGKTTVCHAFKERGYAVISADEISHEVLDTDQECLRELLEVFPQDILFPDGRVNRKRLGDLVFASECKRRLLMDITYPYITARILDRILELSEEGCELILLDAPTLFESRADDFCELVVSVTSPQELRLQRIIQRDGLTQEQAIRRIAAQHSESYYTSRSDYVIRNEGDLPLLQTMAAEISNVIKEYCCHGR